MTQRRMETERPSPIGEAEPARLLEQRSKAELQQLARERNLPGRSLMTKRELIAALKRYQPR